MISCGKLNQQWTGARLNELAQLVTSDIKQDGDIHYFDINDEDPHKGLLLDILLNQRSYIVA